MKKQDVLENNSTATDSEVIQNIVTGERDMFEILLRRYNSLLYKIGRSYDISHDDVQDLMQEAYISAYHNLEKFEARSSFKTWLVQIMLNKCADWKRRAATHATSGTSGCFQETVSSDVRKEILNRELGRLLEKSIEELPEKYRTVFVLRELEGMTVPETAVALQITESNVKIRLKRAKTMLRKQLESLYSHVLVYEFNRVYCDRLVDRVFRQL
ncbi:sigma-70 family RNA polymerase sigma factor [Botryobacter ruber]|uniref:sigma-70 family RNA polymerase sigma factor n=1 Tax=Botryobacter ruber TaxID=2171629 RepID=UPI000E0B777D|nr:sigma-70 family RNA polymerase sigma factor [Botryobacter ruber]